jgi:hypothetical protein
MGRQPGIRLPAPFQQPGPGALFIPALLAAPSVSVW